MSRPRSLLALALVVCCAGRPALGSAEVKLDRDYLSGLIEKLPPVPFQKEGQYRGTLGGYRLAAIEAKSRRFLVLCQVEGEFRPPLRKPDDDARWRHFRFEVRAGVHIEPGPLGLPRIRVDVEEVKRQEMEGVAGTLARFLGRYFDDLVTKIAAGKAEAMNDKLNAAILKKIATFREYGVLVGIDYAPQDIVLRFDLTRYKAEGVAGHVFAAPQPGTVPLYRWSNRMRGAHFYAINPYEADPRIYIDEGIACHVYDRPYAGTIPLYRFRNPRRDHVYTTPADGGAVQRAGYRWDAVACHVLPTPQPGTVPLYRFVDPRTGYHFYTLHPHAEFAK